jgi:molybdopterin molybdotransferase
LLFIKPALDILSGGVPPPMISQTAALAAPYQHEGDRLTFQPARLQNGSLSLLRWAGSADMRTVAQADGFAMLGPGSRAYNAAEQVGFLPLPSK